MASCPASVASPSAGMSAPVRAWWSLPQGRCVHSSSHPLQAASSTRMPCATTSGPTPSPPMTAIRWRLMPGPSVALESAGHEAAHEEPLAEDVEREDGQGRDREPGHHDRDVQVVAILEPGEPGHQGQRALALQEHERDQELVPDP